MEKKEVLGPSEGPGPITSEDPSSVSPTYAERRHNIEICDPEKPTKSTKVLEPVLPIQFPSRITRVLTASGNVNEDIGDIPNIPDKAVLPETCLEASEIYCNVEIEMDRQSKIKLVTPLVKDDKDTEFKDRISTTNVDEDCTFNNISEMSKKDENYSSKSNQVAEFCTRKATTVVDDSCISNNIPEISKREEKNLGKEESKDLQTVLYERVISHEQIKCTESKKLHTGNMGIGGNTELVHLSDDMSKSKDMDMSNIPEIDTNVNKTSIADSVDTNITQNPVNIPDIQEIPTINLPEIEQNIEIETFMTQTSRNNENYDISPKMVPLEIENINTDCKENETEKSVDLICPENDIQENLNLDCNMQIDKSENKFISSQIENQVQINENLDPECIEQTEEKTAVSNFSLNNVPESLETTKNITKSHSKSAENISTINTDFEKTNLNISNTELNTEKILSDYCNKKPKIIATQKLTENPIIETKKDVPDVNTSNNLDLKYKIPKEILPQDLGSIVKNVNSIFSSVSGSLKYAYSHSHRSVPKMHVKKPIPNSKVLDEIFEDSKIEENSTSRSKNDKNYNSNNTENVKIEENSVNQDETVNLQIESLEKLLNEQKKENAVLKERIKEQVDALHAKDMGFKDLETKMDALSKRVETAERDKDAAVMRYASVECAAIEAKRAADKSALAEKNALNEMELMSSKLKSAHSEKQRICQLYDDKCHELSNSEKELAKVREDIQELEGRLKWTQSKLRMEMDAYKETYERAEKLSTRVSELESAKETSTANAALAASTKQLETELSESQAALILCRHERDSLERRLPVLERQLKDAERERDSNNERANGAVTEVELLRAANMRLEQEAAELAALRAQASLADTLSAQLQRELERATLAEETANKERARADTCARREASALAHDAQVTSQHVAATAALGIAHSTAQALEVDNAALREKALSLERDKQSLVASLKEESERRARESKVLARKVAELTEELNEVTKKLEWEKGENDVLRKKHANAIKEMNRELNRSLKRCEQLEAKLSPPDVASTRTESMSSLSSASGESAQDDTRHHNGHADQTSLPDIQAREPDRQALIERIVSLQRAAARRAERCEFLEEHSRQLTSELRNKSRLLRNLLCTLPAGAVASQDSDAHKKEIARLGGGAMAAVWGGDSSGMTLELSLEMNKRLQAVLEDALLKNITLKENMDTLGEEISRLKDRKTTETK